MSMTFRIMSALTLATLLSPPIYAQSVTAPVPLNGTAPNGESATITLAFQNTDIEPVTLAVAKATGQSIIVDPRVKGKVSLLTPKPVTKQGALDLFSSALRSAGFALVQVNGIYRVVPEADAKIQGNAVMTQATPDGDQVITRVFKIKQDSASNLVNVLKPLLTPNSSISANPGNNTIVVTDYASNVKRVAKLIDSMDEPTVGDVQTVHLRHGVAIDVASILNKVVDTTNNPADAGGKTVVIAEPRSNSILIKSSNPEKIRQIRGLITRIDTPTVNSGNIWVVPLRNAEATKLAVTLRAIVAADNTFSQQSGVSNSGAVSGSTGTSSVPNQTTMPQTGAVGQAGSSGSMSAAATSSLTSTSQPSTGGLIQADPPTNSLIITASEPFYRHLRQVIDQLDKRRTQVYVEALIAEVSSTSSARLGVQWQGLINAGGQNVPFGGTNFGATGSGQNIFDLSKYSSCLLNPATCVAGAVPAAGLNVGMLSKFGGNYTMSALIQALDQDTGFRVLSTPNLVTLDNEEARIMVGQNVPILSGSYTTNTSAQTTPFQTYNRQDIGILLRVRPQIAHNGTVRLTVYQEVSQIANQSETIVKQQGYTINKRNIESNIIVDDGQLFVIGGLIDDQYSDGSDGIPFLKDIPLLGQLFRYDSKSRQKNNLMVFLRPYIIKDSKAGEELTANRVDFMQGKQDAFKQAPMLLPKEDLPTIDSYSKPLTHPGPVNQAPTLTQ